jgi:putative Holliday junction resolvase
MLRNGRYLAIDLGRARMGLAVSEAGTPMALPHSVVARLGTRRDILQLLPLCEKLRIDAIVVGLPMQQADDAGSARLCRQFAGALAVNQARPVWLVDEADTTTVAHAELRMLGMKAAKRRTQVDKFAAAVILQRFLDGAVAEQVAAPDPLK